MFELTRVFHVSHVVDDLGKAMDWYRKVFAPEVWQETSLFGNQLALLAVGEVALMPMQPPPAQQAGGDLAHLHVPRPAAPLRHGELPHLRPSRRWTASGAAVDARCRGSRHDGRHRDLDLTPC